MPRDMSAVGASASSSREAAGLKGSKKLYGIDIEILDDGNFTIVERHKYVKPEGVRSKDPFNEYCDPTRSAYTDRGAVLSKVASLIGGGQPTTGAPPAPAPMAGPGPMDAVGGDEGGGY